jgi:hypothetical protein
MKTANAFISQDVDFNSAFEPPDNPHFVRVSKVEGGLYFTVSFMDGEKATLKAVTVGQFSYLRGAKLESSYLDDMLTYLNDFDLTEEISEPNNRRISRLYTRKAVE